MAYSCGYTDTMNKQVSNVGPLKCWDGYKRVPGTKEFSKGSCVKK